MTMQWGMCCFIAVAWEMTQLLYQSLDLHWGHRAQIRDKSQGSLPPRQFSDVIPCG